MTIQDIIQKESNGLYRIKTGAKSIQKYNKEHEMYIHYKVYTRDKELHDFYEKHIKNKSINKGA